MMKFFLLITSILGGQGSPIFWAALHRGYHHPYADTEKDYHSPLHGWWTAYTGWLFKPTLIIKLSFAKDLLIDPYQRFVHRNYLKVFWSLMGLLAIVFGFKLFCILVVLPVFLAMQQENLINLICHIDTPISYRNFDTKDKSTNIYFLGILLWGQGFHNNHHAKPNLYDFGIKPYEIDICRWVVPFLTKVDKICY